MTTPQTGGEENGGERSPTVHGEFQNLGKLRELGNSGKLARTLGPFPFLPPLYSLPNIPGGDRFLIALVSFPDMNHDDPVRDRGTK